MTHYYDAVFISDLHLNPETPEITERFTRWVQWAQKHTRAVYILGDFFHVWAGDDALDVWSESIAAQLASLVESGISLFYMHGNRDFLLGQDFAKRARMTILPDPSVVMLNNERVLLTHGDQYCTKDKGHQWLRRLTRNTWFPTLFLQIPYPLRLKWVKRVRDYSQNNTQKPDASMDIVVPVMVAQMQKMQTKTVIHGHIHQPGVTPHPYGDTIYTQYVLSDWDDNPQILCYYESSGFCFIPL